MKKVEYKIEKDIAIPTPRKHAEYPIEEMNVGDSIVVSTSSERYSFRNQCMKRGLKMSSRQMEDGQFRVWIIS